MSSGPVEALFLKPDMISETVLIKMWGEMFVNPFLMIVVYFASSAFSFEIVL